jgi:hypothetical protein
MVSILAEGEACCLVGTIAREKGCASGAMPRPAEPADFPVILPRY